MTTVYRKWNIWLKLVLPVGCFLLFGVFLLLLTLYLENQTQSRRAFLSLARVNSAFIQDMRLPATARLAGLLGHVLQMDVYFISADREYVPVLRDRLKNHARYAQDMGFHRVAVWADARSEAIKEPLSGNRQLLFIRERPEYWRSIMCRSTGLVLAGYLVLSLLILGWLSRRIVMPLRELAATIPTLHEDTPFEPNAFERRRDEVGLLARALKTMHTRWSDERVGRIRAEKRAALLHMAAGFAHEVKNPVAGMKMHIQLLQSGGSEQERREIMERLLPVFERELNRVENLVNQWMYLIQPEPARQTSCAAVSLLEESIATYQAMANYARVRMDVAVDPLHTVRIDRSRMNMVFGNLIKNAIQAMPEGGVLSIGSCRDGGWLAITFRDTGAGFSSRAIKQATDLFYSEREGGMGVGLTVSREMIEAHGGRLLLANRTDRSGGLVTVVLTMEVGAC